MSIRIIVVGKKHEPWVSEGVDRYQKRLRAPFNAEWILLPHSSFEGDRARQEESERILSRLKQDDFVILLDERGEQFDSPTLATLFESRFSRSESIVLIIGGAYGVDDSVHEQANRVWSLSKLVFPHQIVRLLLVEQLYRSQQITSGGSYHHE